MKTMSADLLVVASGPAGLAAAVTAAENGKDVLVFEKAQTTGGVFNMAMGPFGVESRVQKRVNDPLTKQKAFEKYMEYTHWQVDARLVKAYIDKSGDTIDWLEDMGVEWYGALRHFAASEATWHCPKLPGTNTYGRCSGAVICKALKDRADELGVRFSLETLVTSLIKEDGAVVGLRAKTAAGEEIEARGKAVVIATGGFNKNSDMYKEYFANYMGYELNKNIFNFPFPGPNGDGIRMAREVGAAEDNVNVEMYYTSSRGEEFLPIDIAFRQPNMLINIEGKRFYNEGGIGNTTFTGNALYRQTGHVGYMFFDDATMRHYRKNGPDETCPDHPITDMDHFDEEFQRYQAEVGGDDFIIADTLEEIAERIGMDPDVLLDAVDDYNRLCETYDKEFYKEPKYMRPIKKAPFYMGKLVCSAFSTLGGIKINEYAEVLDKENQPIPGLYAAGNDANSLANASYCFVLPGNTSGFALNTGRIAGESAVDYIDYLDEQE